MLFLSLIELISSRASCVETVGTQIQMVNTVWKEVPGKFLNSN